MSEVTRTKNVMGTVRSYMPTWSVHLPLVCHQATRALSCSIELAHAQTPDSSS